MSVSSNRRVRWTPAAAALIASMMPATSRAQAPSTITIADVVRYTIASSPRIRQSEYSRNAAQAAAVSAGAPFDPTIGTSLIGNQGRTLQTGDVVSPWLATNGYQVKVEKLLRSGIALAPEITLSQRRAAQLAGSYAPRAALGVTVPLLQDRGGSTSQAAERASEENVSAATHAREQTTIEAVRDAIDAFLSYVIAFRRLDVQRASERRAMRQGEDMDRLVKGGERPPAELLRVNADLGSKRVGRIAAEQDLMRARRRLATAMGIAASEARGIGEPIVTLPADSIHVDSTLVDTLVDIALRGRSDLAADEAQRRSADVLLRAAHDGLLPRVDLHGNVVFDGLPSSTLGSSIRDMFGNPRSGLTSYFTLSVNLPLSNAAARGRSLALAAEVRSAELALSNLRREIESSVRLAVDVLALQAKAVAESRATVALYRRTVANARKNYELGSGTILDVLISEDGLTRAELDEVTGQLSLLQAVVALRFETGTLLEQRPDGLTTRLDLSFTSRRPDPQTSGRQ